MSGWNLDSSKTTSRWSDTPFYSSDWEDTYYYSGENGDEKIVAYQRDNVFSHYNKKTQYFYTRYYGWSSNGYYVACPYSSGVCTTYQETGWMDTALAYEKAQYFAGVAYDSYGYKAIDGKAIYWYNQQTREVDDTNSPVYKSQWRYDKYARIYTYYFYRTENLESTSYPSDSDISNIQEWVQYRAK